MYCRHCGAEVATDKKSCPSCGASLIEQRESEGLSYKEGFPIPPWEEEQAHGGSSSSEHRHNRSRTLLAAFLYVLLCFLIEAVGVVIAMVLDADVIVTELACGSVGAAIGIVGLGGKSLLLQPLKKVAHAFREGWWFVAVSVGLMVYDAVFEFAGTEVVSDWFVRSCYTTVLCLFVGMSEEFMFRGLILGGLLDATGKTKRGMWIAVLLSTVMFGAAHITFSSLDYGNPLDLIQAFLKIVETGMLGFFLAVLTIDSGSLMGPVLIHAFGDFFLMVLSVGLRGDSLEVDYVSTGSDAVPTILMYLLIIALYAPMVLKGVRMLRNMEAPEYGPFHRE